MSKSKEIPLNVLNIASRKGISLPEAWEIHNSKTKTKVAAINESNGPRKLTASEKKEKLADEIRALGAEPPASGSVAVFEQALAVAKENAEDKEESEDTEEPEDKDESEDTEDLM